MEEAIKIGAQYGVAGIALVALGWIVMKIGLRLVVAIDKLGEKWEAHATATTSALQNCTRQISDAVAVAHSKTMEELHDFGERLTRIEERYAKQQRTSVDVDFDDGETPPMTPEAKREARQPTGLYAHTVRRKS
jgi:hypothetical protein